MLSLLFRRSLFLVFITAILQIDAIIFPQKSLVIDGLVCVNLLLLLRSFGGISIRLLVRIFSERQFQRNIIGLTTNWLFSRGFLNSLAAGFLIASLLPWLAYLPGVPQDFRSGPQLEVYRNAGLLMTFIAFFLNSSLTFSRLRKLDLTPSRLIFVSYGIATLSGSFLLILPWSLKDGISLPLIDAMFTTVSALAVTGLNSVDFTTTFSFFGQSVVLLLIQIGGLGILALSVAFVAIARKKLSIHHTLMASELYSTNQVGGLAAYIGKLTAATILIESFGTLYIYLALPQGTEYRFFHAVFHAVSAFCNAGFSSFPENLDIRGLTHVKGAVCLLIILGGLGFPVLYEVFRYLKPTRVYNRLSGHSYLVLVTSISLLALGTVGIGLVEWTHTSAIGENGWRILGESFFYSVSSRTAGFNITVPDQLNFASQIVIGALMVIGGSPMSTAGGIKTSTLGVLAISAWSSLQGRRWIQFRKTTVPLESLQKAVAIVFLYFSLLSAGVLLLTILEPQRLWDITFECISALSTVGLTLGITSELSTAGKAVVIFLMLAGRVGLVSLAYLGLGRISQQKHRYADDNYYVG